MEIQLSKLIHRKIVVIGPGIFSQDKLESVKLLAVEDAGIWVESQDAADDIVNKFGVKPASPGVAFFIPYAQITTIMASFDSTAATEAAETPPS